MNNPDSGDAPLTNEQRDSLFDQHLQRLCGLSVQDAGLEQADVVRYVHDSHTERAVIDAVREYADDYDLDVIGRGWVG